MAGIYDHVPTPAIHDRDKVSEGVCGCASVAGAYHRSTCIEQIAAMYHSSVAVDVYSLVAAAQQCPHVPIEGIYRHAHALCRILHAGMYLTPEEKELQWERFKPLIHLIDAVLPSPMLVVESLEEIALYKFRVWLSIGLDQACPILPFLPKINVYTVAVLHDAMAHDGVFGAGNIRTFMFGSANNDALLPVSQYAEIE